MLECGQWKKRFDSFVCRYFSAAGCCGPPPLHPLRRKKSESRATGSIDITPMAVPLSVASSPESNSLAVLADDVKSAFSQNFVRGRIALFADRQDCRDALL